MKDRLIQAALLLYENFGDQGIAWVQEQVRAGLAPSDPDSGSPAEGSTDDEGSHPEDTEPMYVSVETEDAGTDPVEIDAVDDDSYYMDGEAFSSDLTGAIYGMARESIVSPEQVIDTVVDLVGMAAEVRKFEEAQVTKRVGIAAERDVALANIRAKQALLQDYLNRSFDERADNFAELFKVVDYALETDNMNALAMGLESVLKLATTSPFKDLRTVEETAAALSDPEHEWDF